MVDRSLAGTLKRIQTRLTGVERRLSRGFSLPDRLTAGGEQVTDWNDALSNGFYWGVSPANRPPLTGTWDVGEVIVHGSGTILQRVTDPSVPTGPAYLRRRSSAGVWSAWTIDGPRHADFAVNNQNVPNASVTAISTATRDTAYSREGEFATPISGGFSVPAGLYDVSLSSVLSVSVNTDVTRYFAEVLDSISGRGSRVLVGANEDNFAGSVVVYLPSAGNINVRQYQQSGAARLVSIRVKITELR